MNVSGIPSPPTDNLYKFMAISGVVLLIVAPFFWAKFYITQAERTRLAIETLGSVSAWDTLESKARIKIGAPVTDKQKKQVEKDDALQEESGRVMHEFLLYDQFTYVVTGAAIFLGLLGLVLTAFGFPLWYLRVQKPLDQILLGSLERMKQKLKIEVERIKAKLSDDADSHKARLQQVQVDEQRNHAEATVKAEYISLALDRMLTDLRETAKGISEDPHSSYRAVNAFLYQVHASGVRSIPYIAAHLTAIETECEKPGGLCDKNYCENLRGLFSKFAVATEVEILTRKGSRK